jgi:hypothetical protein
MIPRRLVLLVLPPMLVCQGLPEAAASRVSVVRGKAELVSGDSPRRAASVAPLVRLPASRR